ncbi:MAG: amino acid ABC transporter permease [Desulfovibrio sp.]|jgi:polar amino acid transport system permease protein|nr:amino acid ABC transporter permease [Desulfovibrio sp.]
MIRFTLGDILNALCSGMAWTLALSGIAFTCGGAAGFGVMLLRISPLALPRRAATAYIEFFQGTPLLMQLFIIFFGISLAGYDISPLAAAVIGLTLYTSAYLAEIWRGCVDALPEGQWEAASCLAMSRLQQLRFVILPQALRIAVPPTVGFSVQVVKGTAVASIIGFMEMTKVGSMLANATYKPLMVYGLVALGYFSVCFPLSLAARSIERSLHVSRVR